MSVLKIGICGSVIAVFGFVVVAQIVRIVKGKSRVDNKLTDKAFQRIKELNLPDVLQWVMDNLPNDFTKGELWILPVTEKSVGIAKEMVDMPSETLLKCVWINVINEHEKIVLSQLVLPGSILEPLDVVKQGKIYKIPLESE